MGPAQDGAVMPARRTLDAALAAAAAGVALLTLLPAGRGWAWGAPLSEVRWYLTGWDSPIAMLQPPATWCS